MDTPEKQVIIQFIGQLNAALKGNVANLETFLSDDMIVQVSGSTALSGRFPGRRIVRGVLVETLLSRMKLDTCAVRLDKMAGAGSRIATLLTITGKTIEGRVYNPNGYDCGCIFEVKANLITEIWLFPDTRDIETVIFGRRFVQNQHA